MKNYKKNDYAANKNNDAIVYRFDDQVIEVTLESYLQENPGLTEEDFIKTKTLSDEIYYTQDRAVNAQTKKNISIDSLDESETCGIGLMEDEFFENVDKYLAFESAVRLVEGNQLTEIQKRRFELFFFKGFSARRIAKLEGISHVAISKSLEQVEVKLRKTHNTD